ncbi:hypothetical protein ACFQO1_00665 [Jejudonia soesokkakensis]|uniref:Uncharacterized protein n=1 Tax=Jejudonia soesokkakensis TaxID=1323432 RepID=A0ABW2MQM1_9FLAO
MVQVDKRESTETIKEAVEYLEHRDYENIKADIEGYETPVSFNKKGSDISITPDIVAERAGIKHYFDISLKSEKPNLLKSKWRLLEVISRMRKAKFKVITKRGHYSFTNAMLEDLNLEKNMIKL